MPAWMRWLLSLILIGCLFWIPFLHYRANYAHAKRLREVSPGRFYRCGQLTASGLEEAIDRYGIKTVINLQMENQDPNLPKSFWQTKQKTRESELCERKGVRYILLDFDLLVRNRIPAERPAVIDEYLQIMDDPTVYPVLLHCMAGLHRTGHLTGVYRMEYEGWSRAAAVKELRMNGFGDSAATIANDYLFEFFEFYQPGERRFPARDVYYAISGTSARAKIWGEKKPTDPLLTRGEGSP